MSAAQLVHPPGAGLQSCQDGIPHPFARTGAFVRAQARRLRKSLAARERYDQLPVGPRQVMDAAVRLAALHAEDGTHWRPRQPGPEGAELVRAIRPGVVGVVTDAQVTEWLEYLEREGLVSLTGGGLRLSIVDEDAFWKPRPAPSRAKAAVPAASRPTGKRSKAEQARINGARSMGPKRPNETDKEYDVRRDVRDERRRNQGHLPLPIQGGLDQAAASQDAAAPGGAAAQDGTQKGTQKGTHRGTQGTQESPVGLPVGSVGLPVGSASRVPGVCTSVAVVVDKISNINNLTTTATVLPTPRAGANPATQAATQDGAPDGAPAAAHSETAALAAEAVHALALEGDHAALAPRIVRGFLEEGCTPAQIRQVVAARVKTGLSSRSLNVVREPLKKLSAAARRPAAAGAAPPGAEAEPSSAVVWHKDLAAVPGSGRFSATERSWANSLLKDLDIEHPAERKRKALFVYNLGREAFDKVARLRPEIWDLVERDPPRGWQPAGPATAARPEAARPELEALLPDGRLGA